MAWTHRKRENRIDRSRDDDEAGRAGQRPLVAKLSNPAPRAAAVLRMTPHGANPAAKIMGEEELAGKNNYLIGNDPNKWAHGVINYAKVKYEDVYSGIDQVERHVEPEFCSMGLQEADSRLENTMEIAIMKLALVALA